MFTAFGEKRVPAEDVAGTVADAARAWIDGGLPVCEHLADQLLIPLALARGGRFSTGPLSLHTTTNAGVIGRFLDVTFGFDETENGTVVTCAPR